MKKKELKRKHGFYLGYAEFSGIGGFTEQFISELLEKGIPLSRVKMSNGTVTARVSPLHYYTCARAAKKNGVRLRCTGRRGLYFALSRYKKRVGLYIGALVFATMLTYWQGQIQDIDIEGDVSHSQVREILKECGFEKGAPLSGLDFEKARLELLLQVNDAGWADVSCEGYRVLVNIQTAVDRTKMHIDTDAPTNIISTRDAVIIDYKVKNGAEAVSRGSTVKKGQMLVSGTMADPAGNLHYEQAEAEVLGEFYETQEFYVPFKETLHIPDGEKTEYRYFIFMNDIYPLFFGNAYKENSVYTEQTEMLKPFGLETPFYLRTGTFTAYRDVDITRTSDDCLRELKNLREAFEDNFYSDYEIVRAVEDCRADENGITLKIDYTLRGDICEEKEIFISDNTDISPNSVVTPSQVIEQAAH